MTDKPGLRIYLFRHGETDWAKSGQHTGLTDIPLNAHGEEEALNLGAQLGGTKFSHVLTSPLRRARRTCELTNLHHDARVDPDLAEWNYGDYEGLTSADIHKREPEWNLFRDGAPNGESPEQITARIDGLLDRIKGLSGNVALFSHGHIGAVIATRWVGFPVLQAQHFPLATASISVLGFAIHHPQVPVIALWNAAAESLPA